MKGNESQKFTFIALIRKVYLFYRNFSYFGSQRWTSCRLFYRFMGSICLKSCRYM